MCEELGYSASEDKQGECLRLLEFVTGIVPSQMKLWKSNGLNMWPNVIAFVRSEAESRGRVRCVKLPMKWESDGVYTIVEQGEDKVEFHVRQQASGEKILICEDMWTGAAAMASQLRLETNWSETGCTLELAEDVDIDGFKSLKVGVLFRQHTQKRTLAFEPISDGSQGVLCLKRHTIVQAWTISSDSRESRFVSRQRLVANMCLARRNGVSLGMHCRHSLFENCGFACGRSGKHCLTGGANREVNKGAVSKRASCLCVPWLVRERGGVQFNNSHVCLFYSCLAPLAACIVAKRAILFRGLLGEHTSTLSIACRATRCVTDSARAHLQPFQYWDMHRLEITSVPTVRNMSFSLTKSIARGANDEYKVDLLVEEHSLHHLCWHARRLFDSIGFEEKNRDTNLSRVWKREYVKWAEWATSIGMSAVTLSGRSLLSLHATGSDASGAKDCYWLETRLLLLVLTAYMKHRQASTDKQKCRDMLSLLVSFCTPSTCTAPDLISVEHKVLCFHNVDDEGYCEHVREHME
eukprot:6492441-Amphidinium_carterae.1